MELKENEMNWNWIERFWIQLELELNWIEKSRIQLELELNWIEINELIRALEYMIEYMILQLDPFFLLQILMSKAPVAPFSNMV